MPPSAREGRFDAVFAKLLWPGLLTLYRYLMFSERMRYADALEYVRILRPDVHPNDGFQRQLKAYDATVRR